jgi:dTDP-4-amino-4,6-dideoxygalactose transaminase
VTKQFLSELAILGGAPAFEEELHVGRPNIGNRQKLMERIDDILDRRWLTNRGPYVKELEDRIAKLVGVKHCIAMANATIALEIAIRATGMTGEVIVPSLTFVATAHALQWQEITPVFCDVDPETHNLDPRRVEQMITPRTSGIIGVHLWGRPCDVESLADVARRRNLKLLFDAAHAIGCSHKGRMIGNFGDAEVFSFHATKFLNSMEGGALVTNNDELAIKARLMKNFGFVGIDTVVYVGTNGKMNEMSAAMGLTSLESMDEFIQVNYRNYKQYAAELAGLPGITVAAYNEAEQNNYQYVILTVDESETGINRDQLVNVLWAERVLARRYFYPGCHKMEPYRSYYPHAGLMLPVTERLSNTILSLPTGTAVGCAEISEICRIIRLAVENGPELNRRLVQGAIRADSVPIGVS